MVTFLYIAAFWLVLGVVYCVGRHIGRREGRQVAAVEIPIQLRASYQLEQQCPICDDEQGYPFPQTQKQG